MPAGCFEGERTGESGFSHSITDCEEGAAIEAVTCGFHWLAKGSMTALTSKKSAPAVRRSPELLVTGEVAASRLYVDLQKDPGPGVSLIG